MIFALVIWLIKRKYMKVFKCKNCDSGPCVITSNHPNACIENMGEACIGDCDGFAEWELFLTLQEK
jgi:hypothetical protein